MSRWCRYSVLIVSLSVTACGGRATGRAAPEDPFITTGLAALPVASLAGQHTLLLTVGGVVVGDSASPLPGLQGRRAELLAWANLALDSALRRDAATVTWYGLAEQRRLARGAPTLGLQPDLIGTAFLVDRRQEVVPDPLRTQLRSLAALSGARLALAPAAVRVAGPQDALTASLLLVVVDTRVGNVVWRGRVEGPPAATPELAIANAAGRVVAR